MNAKLKPAIEGSEATPEETQKLTQLIEQSELVNGNLISKDHTYALILLTINEAYSSPKDFYPILQNIQATVEEWQANQSRQEYTIIYGGLPYIRALTVDAMKVEQLILWPEKQIYTKYLAIMKIIEKFLEMQNQKMLKNLIIFYLATLDFCLINIFWMITSLKLMEKKRHLRRYSYQLKDLIKLL